MSVKICVEGGGNDAYSLRQFKSSLVRYCEKVVASGHMPRIVASGSRDDAYKDFRRSLEDGDYDVVALLVDSEGPLLGPSSIEHLRRRDGWDLPDSSSDSIFLMAQCMESWLLADRDLLADFYDGGFLGGSLPNRRDIENIPKEEVLTTLEQASRPCQKGRYHKIRHAVPLLTMLDPRRVEMLSPHARRFNEFLRRI